MKRREQRDVASSGHAERYDGSNIITALERKGEIL